MSTQIQFSSPLLKKFSHSNVSVGTSVITILAAADVGEKRIATTIQNKSADQFIEVIFNSTDSVGIEVPPKGNIVLDNYQGIIRAKASAAATLVHIANSSI